MLIGKIALILAAAFAGVALYVSAVEHPARLVLDDTSLLKQWKVSYARGAIMQASLAAIAGILGLLQAWQASDPRWLIGAGLILANWPYTLIGIMPTNAKLKAIPDSEAGPVSRALLDTWARKHAVRTALGFAALAAYAHLIL